MFDLLTHGRILADRVRNEAYANAIRAVVREGDVVLDLGTGTGIHAVLACKAGAAKVYAVESAAIVNLAREVFEENGVADRVEVFESTSERIQVEPRADVMICDLRGVLPYFATALRSILDARTRLLKPNARIVPAIDRIEVALVESPEAWALHDTVWNVDGVALDAARRLAVNATHRHAFTPDEIVSAPERVAEIDYRTFHSTDLATSLRLATLRAGIAHGIALWFDSELAPGVHLSNRPGAGERIYGQLFLPFERPVPIARGESIDVDLSARILDGEDDYLWKWNTSIIRGDSRIPLFRQATFFAIPQLLARRK
jgi:protein arginine N-methyltransferase 1